MAAPDLFLEEDAGGDPIIPLPVALLFRDGHEKMRGDADHTAPAHDPETKFLLLPGD
jgi:hypothetical protein